MTQDEDPDGRGAAAYLARLRCVSCGTVGGTVEHRADRYVPQCEDCYQDQK